MNRFLQLTRLYSLVLLLHTTSAYPEKRDANFEAFRASAEELLLRACDLGDLESVQNMVAMHVYVSCRPTQSDTPLTIAAARGHADVVTYLLDNGALASECNHKKFSPLDLAIQEGKTAVVAIFLKRSRNLSAMLASHNSFGFPPLAVAAQHGRNDIVSLLCANRANPNATTRYNEPLILLAVANNHCSTVRLLHKNGARLPVDALDYASPDDHEMLQLLTELMD
jgi:ankyrin repeat protein